MSYIKKLQKWSKRRDKLIALIESGLSFAEAGRRVSPPISRQRVQRIYQVYGNGESNVRAG